MKTVLFLCTGNYYRSRFAEELFNHHAVGVGLAWTASSRALALERGVNNVGAMSSFTLDALDQRRIATTGRGRMPLACTIEDLQAAARVVALKETEHRPLMRERFPAWENRIDYWQVDDVDVAPPHLALPLIDRQIEALVAELK
jgi:protein-tyrosine-phosphatase